MLRGEGSYLGYPEEMSNLSEAKKIIQSAPTLEALELLLTLRDSASDSGEPPTDREKIGNLVEAFIAKCPPDLVDQAMDLVSGRR